MGRRSSFISPGSVVCALQVCKFVSLASFDAEKKKFRRISVQRDKKNSVRRQPTLIQTVNKHILAIGKWRFFVATDTIWPKVFLPWITEKWTKSVCKPLYKNTGTPILHCTAYYHTHTFLLLRAVCPLLELCLLLTPA